MEPTKLKILLLTVNEDTVKAASREELPKTILTITQVVNDLAKQLMTQYPPKKD